MKPGDLEALRAYYGEKLERYGHDTRSLGWIPGARDVRFGALASIGSLDGCSVLDVGCGFGDLYGYLARRGVGVDYTGVDVSPDFVRMAREAHPGARFLVADFEEGGVGGSFDWAFACGVFTVRISDNRRFVRAVLGRMFEACRIGMAADFLAPAPTGDDAYWRCPPGVVLEFCRGLSRRVVLRADYLAGEYCVHVYKDETADERGAFVSNPPFTAFPGRAGGLRKRKPD